VTYGCKLITDRSFVDDGRRTSATTSRPQTTVVSLLDDYYKKGESGEQVDFSKQYDDYEEYVDYPYGGRKEQRPGN